MPGRIAEPRDLISLDAEERAMLEQSTYIALVDLLDGATLPGYASTAAVFAGMSPEQKAENLRLARIEYIARIAVIEDLAHLLDLLGWSAVERGRVTGVQSAGRMVPPTEPSRRAVAYCIKWLDANGEELEGDQEALEALLRRFGGEV